MQAWWESLSTFEQIFWYIAIPFSVILFIQMILTFAGMGGDDADVGGGESDISGLDLETDIDMDVDAVDSDGYAALSDGDPSFHFFTIRNFIAFFTMFGWGGIAALDYGLDRTWTIIISIIAGLVAVLIITALFYFISRLQDSGGGINIRFALGKIGNVYLPIKANGGNIGKIQVTVQGGLREMQAITKDMEDLPTGTVVKVVGIASNSILVVKKINQS